MEKEPDSQVDILKSHFLELRNQIHEQMERKVKERKETNPTPTEEEIYLGAFKEQIEPQVRNAVFKLLGKGYELTSSGFGGEERPNEQHVGGFFSIDEATKGELAKRNIRVDTRYGQKNSLQEFFYYPNAPYTTISFQCEVADLNEIKKKWDEIADLLPRIHDKMIPSRTNMFFAEIHAPERIDLQIFDLERRLNEEVLPEDVKGHIELRLKALYLQQELRGDLSDDARKEKEKMLDQLNNLIEKEQEEAEAERDNYT